MHTPVFALKPAVQSKCKNEYSGSGYAETATVGMCGHGADFLKIAGTALIQPKPHYCFQKCNCITQSRIWLLIVSQDKKSASTICVGKYLLAIGTGEITWKVVTGQTENSNRNYERILFLISNTVQNRSWLTKQWQCESGIAKAGIKFYCFSQKHNVTLWATTSLTAR